MAESKEQLKCLLMKVKEDSEKAGLRLNLKKMKIMIWSHHFLANSWGKNGNSDRFYFIGLQNTADSDYSHEIKRSLLLRSKAMTDLDSV